MCRNHEAPRAYVTILCRVHRAQDFNHFIVYRFFPSFFLQDLGKDLVAPGLIG